MKNKVLNKWSAVTPAKSSDSRSMTSTTKAKPEFAAASLFKRSAKTVVHRQNWLRQFASINSSLLEYLDLQGEGHYRPTTHYLIHPVSSLKKYWDLITALSVIYLFWSIPITISFSWWKPGSWSNVLNVFFDVWFAFDILLNFRTGFVDAETGRIIMNPREIMRHYTHSIWFKIDLLACVPFELVLFMFSDDTQAARKSIKMVKYLKLPKLLRVRKFIQKTSNYKRFGRYNNLLYLFAGFVALVHVSACVWVWCVDPCATLGLDDVEAEAVEYPTAVQRAYCHPDSIGYMYFASVHLGLQSFLGISNDHVHSQEHFLHGGKSAVDFDQTSASVFAAASLINIVGSVFMALVFGNIVFLVQSWNHVGNEFRKTLDQMDYEVDSLRLPTRLRKKVRLYYDYLYMNKKSFSKDVMILQDPGMSQALRRQIAIVVYKDLLSHVSFLAGANDEILGKICILLHRQIVFAQEYIFKRGEVGRELYIIAKGQVLVLPESIKGRGASSAGDQAPVTLEAGQCFGEIGVFIECERSRSIQATTLCDLCILEKSGFDQIMLEFPHFQRQIKEILIKRSKEVYKLTKEEEEAFDAGVEYSETPNLSPQDSLHRFRSVFLAVHKAKNPVLDPKEHLRMHGSFKTQLSQASGLLSKIHKSMDASEPTQSASQDGSSNDDDDDISNDDDNDEEEEEEEKEEEEKEEHDETSGTIPNDLFEYKTRLHEVKARSRRLSMRKTNGMEFLPTKKGSIAKSSIPEEDAEDPHSSKKSPTVEPQLLQVLASLTNQLESLRDTVDDMNETMHLRLNQMDTTSSSRILSGHRVANELFSSL